MYHTFGISVHILPAETERQWGGSCADAGMLNTRLFKKIMANSPGGVIDGCSIQGSLPIFMSAGLQDDIFPINVAGNPVRFLLLS